MVANFTRIALFVSLFAVFPTSQAVVLDFESFTNGQIIDDEYDASFGVNISASNPTGADLAVVFDSTPLDPDTQTLNTNSDPDLMGPFGTFNPALSSIDPGNILIIQENMGGCSLTDCSTPDDEGSRPAGVITFIFDDIIKLLSIDFFDIEEAEDGTDDPNKNGIRLYSDVAGNTEIAAGNYFTPDVSGPDGVGDNLWDQVMFGDDATGIRRIDVHFGGSGALDNLSYSVVPVPASVWLFGTALLGFIGFSRRRSI